MIEMNFTPVDPFAAYAASDPLAGLHEPVDVLPATPVVGPVTTAQYGGAQLDSGTKSRNLDLGWFLQVDLGPDTGSLGCGGEGSTGVPDRIAMPFLGIEMPMRHACDNHDAGSVEWSQRNNQSLGELFAVQGRFFRDLVADAGDNLQSKLFALGVGSVYTAAVTTAALGHWGISRVLDGWDWASSAVSSAWDSFTSLW